jgi:hypothetical protein
MFVSTPKTFVKQLLNISCGRKVIIMVIAFWPKKTCHDVIAMTNYWGESLRSVCAGLVPQLLISHDQIS